jgi:hypothetical protein
MSLNRASVAGGATLAADRAAGQDAETTGQNTAVTKS